MVTLQPSASMFSIYIECKWPHKMARHQYLLVNNENIVALRSPFHHIELVPWKQCTYMAHDNVN